MQENTQLLETVFKVSIVGEPLQATEHRTLEDYYYFDSAEFVSLLSSVGL